MKEPDHSSPKWTFVAQFSDGTVTRMTTFCANGKLDLERGIAVARGAYQSKTGNNKPPPLVAAKFIEPGYNDKILKEYNAADLEEVETAEPETAEEAGRAGAALAGAHDARWGLTPDLFKREEQRAAAELQRHSSR